MALRRSTYLFGLAVVATLSLAAVGVAQTSDSLQAEIAKRATLAPGGDSAQVRVTVTCPAGREVLEAFVYLVQDGNTSQFAGLPVTCDGEPHTVTVTVHAFEETPVHRGKARASGYVLVYDSSTEQTESVSPTRIVKLR